MKTILTSVLTVILSVVFRCAIAQSCSDLFISEYIEGSSFNKIIEIYNPTTGTVQLDGYQLFLFSNGSDTSSFNFKLHGPLASNDVYVISHAQADSNNVIPIVDTTNLVCNWNGNDAVILVNNIVGDTIDMIGVIGEDPGTEWIVGSGSTKDHTLVRMETVQEGTTDWVLGSTQWLVYPQDDFTHLNSHSMIACTTTTPELSISTDITEFVEGAGSFSVQVYILNPNANATSVDVDVTGGTATQGSDYQFTNQTVTFPGNGSAPIPLNITVVNDPTVETDETIELSISNATNNAIIAASSITIKILDDDALGISNEVPVNTVSIFPNPAIEVLYFSTQEEIAEIRIQNILGEEVLRVNPEDKWHPVLQLGKLPSGVYFLKINSNGNLLTKEFIKG